MMAEAQLIMVSGYKKFWRNYKKSPAAIICFYYVITLFLIALFASIIAPPKMIALNPRTVLKNPQWEYLLGTDNLGRNL